MRAVFSLKKPEGLTIAIIFLYVLALSFQIKQGNQSLFGKVTLTVFFPLLKAAEYSSQIFNEGFQAYIWQKDAVLRGEELYKENLLLRGELYFLKSLQDENRKLRETLKIPWTENRKFVIGKSLISYGTPFTRSILLSIDDSSLIEEKSAVMDNFGVVGRIEEIKGEKARVLLLTDPSSAIGIVNQRSGISGVAIGNGRNLLAKYITNEADVIEGDIFLTSGQDEVFPFGIPVGRVVSVENGGDYLKKITISPMASFDSLSYVLILQREK